MGFESWVRRRAQLVDAPPAHCRELARIGVQYLILAAFEGKPQADVGMAGRRRADRLGDRQEERSRTGHGIGSCLDAKFFDYLTTHRVRRVFTGFDVPAGGQPQPR